MGDIPGRKKTFESETQVTDSQNFFVDREVQRQIFNKNLGEVSTNGSRLLYYAGLGGVGKTALINELKNSVQGTSKEGKFKYINYDFTHGTEMLAVLSALKKSLSDKYYMEFPFFEKGLLSYYKKRGDPAGMMQIENILKGSTFARKARKYIDNTLHTSYDAGTLSNVGTKVLDEGIELFDMASSAIPILKALKMTVDLIDKSIMQIEKYQLENDRNYIEVSEKLKKREKAATPEAIKEYLPTLFAQDISLWLKKNKLNLIVFLDTYEQLTDDEKDTKRHEKLIYRGRDVPADWWIEELLYDTRGVLWVIAGRGEIKKIGETLEINQSDTLIQLKALDDKFSDEFLSKAGIEDSALREGIVKLTGGYPIYLTICVDTYHEIVSAGRVPTLEDFGDKREFVIKRLLDFMNDTTRNMVKRLCIMGRWTDDCIECVLSILHENNVETYNRVKKLSFVSAQTETIFTFDRSIQKVLLDHLNENENIFIKETFKAAEEFFYKVFYETDSLESKNFSEDDKELFFHFWCELILRTTNDADYLMEQYAENLEPVSSTFNDNVTEVIIEQFQARIKELCKTADDPEKGFETVPYAYFEHLLAKIKLSQNNVKMALEIAESAYRKFEDRPLNKNQTAVRISVIGTLADVYSKLKRTATEIDLREKAVILSEEIYKNITDKHIIAAKYALAKSLENGDKQNRALEIYAEIYHTLEPLNNDMTMTAANLYAFSLNSFGVYGEALTLWEKIADFYRRAGDHQKLIKALYFLQLFFNLHYSKEFLKKLLNVNHEIFEIKKNFYGEYSSSAAAALTDYCDVLKKLNRIGNAKNILKNFAVGCENYLEIVENLEEKIKLMETLRDIFDWLEEKDKVIMWEENRLQIFRDFVKEQTAEPIEDYDAAIGSIEILKNNLYLSVLAADKKYNESISLQHKLIELSEKNPDSSKDEVINAKKELAYTLATQKKGYSEALKLRKDIVEYYKAKYPDDEANDEILSAMQDLVNLLEYYIGDYKDALTAGKEILRRLNKQNDPNKIFEANNRIARLLNSMEDYAGEIEWREKIFDFCLENFVEDSPEVINSMEKLSNIYVEVGEYNNAENLMRKIAAIKTDKHGSESNLDVIEVKESIAEQLHYSGRYDEELVIRQEIVELYLKNREENGGGSLYITNALSDVAELWELLGHSAEAYVVRLEIVDEYKKDYNDFVATEYIGEDSPGGVGKLECIAKALHNVNDYDTELTYRQKILDFYKAVNENSVDTANALYAIADIYHETNNSEEETKTLQRILEIHKKILDDLRESSVDDELIISEMQDVAAVEMDLGNVAEMNHWESEILSVRRDAVKKFENLLGKTAPETFAALENLADTLATYNRYDEELTVRREILERFQAFSIDEVIKEILKTKDAIAVALENQNDFRGVLEIRQEILESYLTFCNETDDDAIKALSNVADTLELLDDYGAVLNNRHKIVTLYETKYFDDERNGDLIESKMKEAEALVTLEDFDAAFDIYKNCVELYTKKYGKSGFKHDATLAVRQKIARLLVRKKDFDAAATEYEEIIELMKEKYSESHSKVIQATIELDDLRDKMNSDNVGKNEIFSSQLETAIEYQPEILKYDREFFGNGYYNVLKILEKMALNFEKISRPDETDKTREEKLKVYEKIKRHLVARFGESHKIISDLMCVYAAELGKLKRYDEAAEMLRRADEIYKSKFGFTQFNLRYIGVPIEEAKDLNEAVEICQRYIGELKEKLAGYEFCHVVINALKTLVNLHVARKDFDAAVAVQNEIVELLKRRYEGYENVGVVIDAQKEIDRLTTLKEKSGVTDAVEKIDKNSGVKLRKGQKYDLQKNNPQLSLLTVQFGWDDADFDIDRSAYLLGANGKVRVDEDFIFYNNPFHESGSVEYSEDTGQIKVDLSKIPDDVERIELTLTIYDAEENGKNFSQVTGAYISIIDAQNKKELFRFDLSENISEETAIVAGEIYRHKGAYKFNAIGRGFVGGLEKLCKNFGVTL